MIWTLVALLLAYQLKHFFADYPLQGKYMLGKFNDGWAWVIPLLAHVAVHALGTFLITCWFGVKQALFLSLFDAIIHFTMDRIKASKRYLGRFKPDNKFFWWSLGFDQMVHHLTHYTIIIWILGSL